MVSGGSVAECWTQAQKGPGSNRSRYTLSGNSLRQTVHTHCASVHQAAKLVAALLRVARVTAGLAESNGSLPCGFMTWLTAKNRDQPRNPMLGNRVWATLLFIHAIYFISRRIKIFGWQYFVCANTVEVYVETQ